MGTTLLINSCPTALRAQYLVQVQVTVKGGGTVTSMGSLVQVVQNHVSYAIRVIQIQFRVPG